MTLLSFKVIYIKDDFLHKIFFQENFVFENCMNVVRSVLSLGMITLKDNKSLNTN